MSDIPTVQPPAGWGHADLGAPNIPTGPTVSEQVVLAVKQIEGCEYVARPDVDGVLILGYGCKIFDGKPVVAGQKTDEAGADRNLRAKLNASAREVLSVVHVPLKQGQLDALADFVYNAGLGSLQHSTLLTNINAKLPVEEHHFVDWDNIHQGSKLVELPGLKARRKREYQWFSA